MEKKKVKLSMLYPSRVILTRNIKVGDIICHEGNFAVGLYLFDKATEHDVEIIKYGTSKKKYLKLI